MTYRDENAWLQAGIKVLLRQAIARKGALLPRGLPMVELIDAAHTVDADIELEAGRWMMMAEAKPGIPVGVRKIMIRQAEALIDVYRRSNA